MTHGAIWRRRSGIPGAGGRDQVDIGSSFRSAARSRNMTGPSGPASSRAPPQLRVSWKSARRCRLTAWAVRASTTRASNTTPVASRSSPTCGACAVERARADRPASRSRNLEHRGATGAEADTGDGAGILLQIPDRFLRASSSSHSPPEGSYAVGHRRSCRPTRWPREGAGRDRGHRRRRGPRPSSAGATCRSTPSCLGATARAAMPTFKQLFVTDADRRHRASTSTARCSSPASGSSTSCRRSSRRTSRRCRRRTLVYKGMLTTPQLAAFFPDLADERFESALAARAQPLLDEHVPVVAARPPVPLRRPQRRDQHGAGQRELDARPRGDGRRARMLPGLERAFPICTPGASDTARFDEVLELLHLGGRPLPPRRADDDPRGVGEQRRRWTPAGGRSTASTRRVMEPWDGPASVPSPTAP